MTVLANDARKSFWRRAPSCFLFLLCLLMTGCVPLPTEPPIHLTTTILPSAILALPPPPPLLTPEEELSPWGLEYRLGRHFAIDGDYYRAATCFHRSRYLLDSPSSTHAAQLLHALLITYSLGGKYQEAINVWEAQQNITHLDDPDLARDCIGLLYEAYTHINQPQKAEELLKVLPASDVLTTSLPLFGLITANTESSLVSAPAVAAAVNATARDEAKTMAEAYLRSRKDPTTARVLNAVLPGSGYLYVGQYQTAATSLAINALFIAATWQLFVFHQPAAGCIAGSLEGGWYLGGIVGAGLSADLYNQRLREQLGRPYLERFSLFPLRLLRYGW